MRYWDSVVDGMPHGMWERHVAAYYKQEHIRLMEKWGGKLAGKTFLKTDLFEEAIGEGDFLFWPKEQGAAVWGMDISLSVVSKTRERAQTSGIFFSRGIVSDVRRTSFQDGSFDVIFSASTLDNLSGSDVEAALSELHRVLKPGGTLILTLDNAHNPLYCLGYALERIFKTNKYYQGHCYSVAEATRLVEAAGFRVKEATSIVHIPTPFNKIAMLLSRLKNGRIERIVGSLVVFFAARGEKAPSFLTGWFIALKLVKP